MKFYLLHIFRYLRCFTIRRAANALKCRCSFFFARIGVLHYDYMPLFVALEPADWCILKCRQCLVGLAGNREITQRHIMKPELYHKVIDETAPYAHTLILHFQGEPLLSPYLEDMVAYAHKKRLFTVFSTNAQLLDSKRAEELAKAGLDEIIISLDGLTQESYTAYREGGSINRVFEGIRAMSNIERGHRPEIVVQCLMLKSNETEWDEMRRCYKQLGADRLVFKTAQFYDFEHGNYNMPSDNRYCRYYQDKQGAWHIKKPLLNRCYRLWSGCVITAIGDVRPCCYAKSKEVSFGNITNHSLKDVLRGGKAIDFRKKLFTNRKSISICCNCDE